MREQSTIINYGKGLKHSKKWKETSMPRINNKTTKDEKRHKSNQQHNSLWKRHSTSNFLGLKFSSKIQSHHWKWNMKQKPTLSLWFQHFTCC